MKTMLRGSVAVIAFVAMTGVAQAQSHQTTNTNHYASSAPIGANPTTYNATTPAQVAAADAVLAQGQALPVPLGTKYTATTSAPDDTEEATPTVATAFNLKGTVNKDCSFYAGNTAGARTIDFGVIGVRTGDNENVGSAFEMAGPLTANINTLTAGCNSNNKVTIEKGDQFGSGLTIVGAPSGYDQTQFRTNIAYTVTATWTGVAKDSIVVGEPQTLEVGLPNASNSKEQGAWRSAMNIAINAPVADRALIAGTYTDTLTVTLSAL